MSAKLTTHVLDSSAGKPAQGVRVEVYRLTEDGVPALAASGATNADGRMERPLLEGADFPPGNYEIRFHIGEYFRNAAHTRFLPTIWETIPVRFTLHTGSGHFHIPLLAAPGSYTTYRGS